ncbi:glycosyltransferase family 61 protein [Agrobacterium vitis]
MNREIYEIVTCDELAELQPSRVSSSGWLPNVDISIPSISYGQKDPPEFECWQWPPNNWREPSYSVHGAKHYVFRDAKIHSESGVITIGNYCIKESLYFVFPEAQGWKQPSENQLEIPTTPIDHISKGFHALCGHVGNRNYAHWWIDIVPVLGHHVLRQCFDDATPILPQIRSGYQRQTLDLIPEVKEHYFEVAADKSLLVNELHFVPSLTGADYHPQPWNTRFIQELKSRAGVLESDRRGRLIYLSRRDASARKMLNEDKVCEIAEASGFEVLEAAGMNLVDQIRTFAAATHVISPHGAGLANLMFSAPGTRMLELHYDNSVNWSLRRMAASCNLSYGCLVGRQLSKKPDQTDEAAKENGWFLPEDQFKRVISTRPFVEKQEHEV